jgi:hypothetical protein
MLELRTSDIGNLAAPMSPSPELLIQRIDSARAGTPSAQNY